MKLSKEIPTPDKSQADLALLHMLDRGIDDMESGPKEIHILRVLRHKRNWADILLQKAKYTYPR